MSTFYSLHFHVIFSTKYRKICIQEEWIDRLHAYLGGALNGLGGVPLQVGGVGDHVHLLVGCKTTHRPCDVVRELKKSSTTWVHEEIGVQSFGWQDGYAIFSVSPGARDDVASYIRRQAAHHRQLTFREELEQMLQRAGVSYDPVYLE